MQGDEQAEAGADRQISKMLNAAESSRTATAIAENDSKVPVIHRTTRSDFAGSNAVSRCYRT